MPELLLFLVSILAGGVGAVTGMGGGVILIPALTVGWGLDIKRAIALSVLSMLAISNGAASRYIKHHMPNLRLSSFLEVYAVIGAVIGSFGILAFTPRFLFICCGTALLIFGVALRRRPPARAVPHGEQDRYSSALGWQGSYYDEAEGRTISYHGRHAAIAGPLMCVAAMASGLLGMGGSALIVLMNDLVIGLPQKVALTTSNLVIGVMALTSADLYLKAGLIETRLVAPVLLGVALGALIGSRLILKLTNRTVRTIFVYVLIALGFELLIRGIRLW